MKRPDALYAVLMLAVGLMIFAVMKTIYLLRQSSEPPAVCLERGPDTLRPMTMYMDNMTYEILVVDLGPCRRWALASAMASGSAQ